MEGWINGQMDGKKLEEVMLDFIDGAFDVLVSTTIIERKSASPRRTFRCSVASGHARSSAPPGSMAKRYRPWGCQSPFME